jgi:O-antigen/teichoic acid export membrane protein
MSNLESTMSPAVKAPSRTSPLFRLAALVLFFSYSDYGLQFLYQMAVGRLLTVEDYGIYSALNSINISFTLFATSFPLLALRSMSHVAAHHPERFWPSLHQMLRVLSGPLLIFGAVVFAASPWLKDFFHLQSSLPIWIAVATCVLTCYQNTLLAVLQAMQLYAHNSALTFAFTFMRFAFGVVLIYFFHTNYLGIFVGLLFATILTSLWVFSLLWRKIPHPTEPTPADFSYEGWQNAILVSLSMVSLVGIDVSLARHFLLASEAGLYSAAASVARIILVISQPFVGWVVPEVTRSRSKAGSSISLPKLVTMTVGISLLAWGVVSLIPGFILSFMLGGKFTDAAHLVPPLAASSLCLGNVALMNHYCFALGIRNYFYILYAAALVGIGLVVLLFHHSAVQLAYGIMGSSMAAAVLGCTALFVLRRRYVK